MMYDELYMMNLLERYEMLITTTLKLKKYSVDFEW